MPALPAATERGGDTSGAACAEAQPAASSSSGWWRRSSSRRACGASASGTATHAMAARGRGGAGPSWWAAEHLLLLLLACLGLACICPTTGSPLPGSNPPPYLKICHRSDPVLNTCIKDSINTLIRNIKTGSPSLGVQETDPLHVDFVEVDEGGGNVSLRMSLSDINIAGLSDTNVVSVKANLLDSKFEVISKTPSFTVHGAFEGRGALLTFPLVANGLFWINMTDVTAVWILFYHTEARQDGKSYIALDEFGLDVIPSDVSYKFGEQLDGDNELAPYIKPCSRNDINLDECALRSARAALPGIIKGDRKFGVQPLDPLRLTEVLLEQGRGLSLALRNVDVIGLHATDINSVRLDLPKDTVIVNLTVPHIEILGKYVVKGKIMVLPITGKGNANITLDDVRVSYTFQHDVVRKADGKQYIRGKNNSLTLTAGWGSAHLDNLFNGDKRLGDAMNKFINENWRIVMEEIRAPIEETIVQVVERILTSFTSKVPYEEILLA